jgi:hypothetical protein
MFEKVKVSSDYKMFEKLTKLKEINNEKNNSKFSKCRSFKIR